MTVHFFYARVGKDSRQWEHGVHRMNNGKQIVFAGDFRSVHCVKQNPLHQ